MPFPLKETQALAEQERHLRKVEFLPIPSIVADFQLNLNTETLLRSIVDMWRDVVGVLRLEGLYKTFRLAAQSKPADGHLRIVGKDRINDGETFTITDGSTLVTFEFDVAGNGVSGGNTAVDISSATSIDDVRDAVINAINASVLTITAQSTLNKPAALGGGGLGPDIDLFNTNTGFTSTILRDAQNDPITDTVEDEDFLHRGMSGARLNRAVGSVLVVEPGEINDAETFVIPAQAGNPQETYEFDKDASVTGGNIAVDISGAADAHAVAIALQNAINGSSVDMVATASPILASGYITALDPSKIFDGETFTLNDGTNPPTIFEFDKDASVSGANIAIDISSATKMQDVRTAIINAINGVGSLAITASNPGFGKQITLTNSQTLASANTGAITHTITHQDFYTGPMQGFRARVGLINTTAGIAYNQALSHTVIHADFSVEGMSFGAGDGWDITSGRCAFEGYNIELSDIPRLQTVVGKQNFLKCRVTERRLTFETAPDEIEVSIPGVVSKQKGANLYRWSAELLIEAFDATPPTLQAGEVLATDGVLCEFDSTNGQTIVANSEVPIRATKFGKFIEPQDVASKVSKLGDTMTGKLSIAASGTDSGIEATGGVTDGIGGKFTGQGTAVGVDGRSHATTGEAGVLGVGGTHGVKGQTAKDNGIGVLGEATGTVSITGVKGIGSPGLGAVNAGPGVHARGGIGLYVEKLNSNYPHIRVIPSGDSGLLPSNAQQGDLTIPSTGGGAGKLYMHDGSVWDTVRPSTLGKVGNVQNVASSDRDVLRYNSSNARWERVQAVLQEKMYFPAHLAHTSVSNATLSNPILNLSRGEIAIMVTGTGGAGSLEVTWCIPVPPGFESWGSAGLHALVIPVKFSNSTTALYNIEVYDSVQASDISTTPAAMGVTTYVDTVILDTQLTGNYKNSNNNQGNMVVKAVASFGNGDTVEIGGLYIKSRDQIPFGSLFYNA